MTEREGRRNKIQGVSLSPEMLEQAKSRAESQHGGNLSRYIQSLIEADMRQIAKPQEAQPLTAKYVIADATTILLPEWLDEAPGLIRGRNQAEIMRSLLVGLFRLLQREDRVRHIANIPFKRFAVIPSFDCCMEEDGWAEVISEVCAEEIKEADDEWQASWAAHEAAEREAESYMPDFPENPDEDSGEPSVPPATKSSWEELDDELNQASPSSPNLAPVAGASVARGSEGMPIAKKPRIKRRATLKTFPSSESGDPRKHSRKAK